MPARNNATTLVLGTAHTEAVRQCMAERAASGEPFVLLVNRQRYETFRQEHPDTVHAGTRPLGLTNLRFAWLFARMRPSRVYIVCGEIFFHNNVLQALLALSFLLRTRTQVFLFQRGGVACMNGYYTPKSFWVDAFFLALVPLGFLLLGWKAGLIGLAGALLLEWLMARHHAIVSNEVLRDSGHRIIIHRTHETSGTTWVPHPLEPAVKSQTPNNVQWGQVTLRFTRQQWTHTTSIDKDWCRKTTDEPERYEDKPHVAMLGASYPQGAYLADAQTLSWKLQERFAGLRIKCHCTPTHSSWASYILMRALLRSDDPPRLCVYFSTPLTESAMHPGVDPLTPMLRPLSLRWRGRLVCLPWHHQFPLLLEGRHIVNALYTWLAKAYALVALRGVSLGDITRRTIELMREECERHGVEFLLAAGHGSASHYPFLHANGYNWSACTRTADGFMEQDGLAWTVFPFAFHPNAAAHALMAQAIGDRVEALLADRAGVSPADAENVAAGEKLAVVEAPAEIYPLF